jgi:hypothetical protein
MHPIFFFLIIIKLNLNVTVDYTVGAQLRCQQKPSHFREQMGYLNSKKGISKKYERYSVFANGGITNEKPMTTK